MCAFDDYQQRFVWGIELLTVENWFEDNCW